ncbi:hypothetical protein EUTSA_v10011757mg [Eutrema salsugineum]|uniref:DNA-binding protein At1g48610 n=1 Tax=Eutrema salsugineum TaxID=72664 RepID=V4KHK5_EUTSA|nr:putative DNA-binding protein At1g48610 [Eutrema salsugineum]ESQ30669.1 hypothetical protein EUTSA_v10011757mg [Eutrema salsugineum]
MAKRSETPSATHGTGLEPPRSGTAGDSSGNQLQPDLTGVSAATASQKRGRGRPPKPKSDSQQNGAGSAQPTRKPSGRPKRNGATAAAPAVPTASAAATAVKSGRGRPRRSNTLPVKEAPVPTVDGSRKRGRPKKDDVAATTVPANTVAAPAQKRGRKPKSEEVASKRTVGRPKKATEATTTGKEAADPKELKKKAALLQKKVKQAADKLKIAVSAIEEVQEIAAGM